MTSQLFEPLRLELQPLADRFAAAGHRLFLVGGTVRDLLLGASLTSAEFDVDATTTAHPEEIKRLLHGWADSIWTQGERFGTIGAVKRVPGDGPGASIRRIYEITTHRAEAYDNDSRKPTVQFSADLRTDLSRRDFTVNAMAIDLTAASAHGAAHGSATGDPVIDLVIVDPFGGRVDLAARRLRTPLSPELSFSDDPLRMLRAARFIAKYELVPTAELTDAVVAMADRLVVVSVERIRDELHKLLAAPHPAAGLWFCAQTKVLEHVLPELAASPVSCLEDAIRAVDPSPGQDARLGDPFDLRLVRLAALTDHLDRPEVRMNRLRHPSVDVRAVESIVRGARRLRALAEDATAVADGDLRRLVVVASPWLAEAVELAFRRAVADGPTRATLMQMSQRLAALAATEDLAQLGPEIDGLEVMKLLQVPAGRDVGVALDYLRTLRLDEGPIGAERAAQRLRSWWAQRAAT